jgi:hypothetical protein
MGSGRIISPLGYVLLAIVGVPATGLLMEMWLPSDVASYGVIALFVLVPIGLLVMTWRLVKQGAHADLTQLGCFALLAVGIIAITAIVEGISIKNRRQQEAERNRQQIDQSLESAREALQKLGLMKCTDCGRQISPRAASCPNCGAPGPKQ